MYMNITLIQKNYDDVYNRLSNTYEEVNGYDFYRYIFPNNENKGELSNDYSRPNAIYLYKDDEKNDSKRTLRRRIMLNDTWEDDYMSFVEYNELALCSGLSYLKRANRLENASKMNALVFDLDGVGEYELKNILLRMGQKPDIPRTLPIPTFIVMSGGGLHLYYVFEEPIELYPNIKIQLKSLKHDLTFRMWEYKSTSKYENIQYQSINQGFRMVGSINNKYNTLVRAFKTGDKVSLDYLNSYVKEKNRVDINRPFRPSQITRDEAKEKYPEWYQRVVVEKKSNQKKWDIAGKVNGNDPYALYHWWLRQIDQIKGGHRYYFLMCMVIYACKCDVPKKKLKEDINIIYEQLKLVEHENQLEKRDIESALECWSREYYNFTIEDIEKLTDVHIEKNKRNYQKQEWHLEDIRSKKENMKRRGQAFKNPEGRPDKKQIVRQWREANPEGSKYRCIKETGLSKPTVYKWW